MFLQVFALHTKLLRIPLLNAVITTLTCRGLCSQMEITGTAKILLTRRASKDAPVAVSLSKPMRGDARVVGIL
jgi:hypothetical protein